MPCFNDDGDYVGPLLRCPHSHADRACGFQDGTWKSAATAAYPSEFAAFFARLSLSVVPELRAVADSDLIPANIPSSAEAFATECITRGSFDRASVQILFDLLPKTRPHKITGNAEPGTAFFGGTVHQEGLTAPRSTCFTFPESMRVINAFLHSVDPHHRYAAFVLTKNVTSEVHRDPRNADVPNLIVAISSFSDGGIWVQDDSGTQALYTPYLQDGPVYLDARGCLHATQPWVGDRLIAIAYTPQNVHLLSADDSAFLASLGFPVLDSSPAGGEAPAESFVSSDNFTLAAAVPARAFGQPMICKFEMGKQEFVDSFGLCSPGRWAPEAREKLASSDEVAHAEGIRGLLRDFVIDQLKDPKDMAFRLATGHVKNSPFAESALQKLRQRIVGLIPGASSDLLRVPERQPFHLYLLAESLRLLGDPDWEILVQGEECYAEGMPVGFDSPLPTAPQVFRPRDRFRKLDESEFEPQMQNYSSAELSSDKIEEHFRAEEREGLMVATTEGAVKAEYGGRHGGHS
ncbi:glyQS [Symbiodinium sp. CCMP2592]|nr:glyQS [Symbiodinium sp. CCMP2592]